MEVQSNTKAYVMTIAGAVCWGLIGLFITPLYVRGFTAWDVVAIRGIFSFVFLFLVMLLFYRDQLRTRLKDHLFFASAGIFSLAFFNFFFWSVFPLQFIAGGDFIVHWTAIRNGIIPDFL